MARVKREKERKKNPGKRAKCMLLQSFFHIEQTIQIVFKLAVLHFIDS